MARKTLILILISLSTLAKASYWKYIGTVVETGTTSYVDAESVLVEADASTFWNYL